MTSEPSRRHKSPSSENVTAQDCSKAYFVDVRTPLCFIVDREQDHRHFMSLALQSHGIETSLFPKAHALHEGLSRRTPDLIFLDVPIEPADAIQSIRALGERCYRGPVQLMGAAGADALENVRQFGERSALRMLSPLQKPVDRAALRKVIQKHNLGSLPCSPERASLEEALRNDWIEFWYQPKIDLRKKKLAGVEMFARVRHPQRGILLPGAFMDDASEKSLVDLTEKSLIHALKSELNFSMLGIKFRFAINVSMHALAKVPITAIMRDFRPKSENWCGVILDVTEDQVASDLSLTREIATQLESCKIKLAIDDFGRGYLPLGRLRELSFAELKLERSFVTDCATDKGHAAICRSVIELAHNFDAKAVAVGVEKPADAHALFRMGCDLGQGYLFAQPMAQDRFLILLRQRAEMTRIRPFEAGGTET
jgi:EAL domain-containing protein (putative c-di-GMP-specific phosphodiesterase class I)